MVLPNAQGNESIKRKSKSRAFEQDPIRETKCQKLNNSVTGGNLLIGFLFLMQIHAKLFIILHPS